MVTSFFSGNSRIMSSRYGTLNAEAKIPLFGLGTSCKKDHRRLGVTLSKAGEVPKAVKFAFNEVYW